MVSPAVRRNAVRHLLLAGFSRVRACRVIGMSRSSSRRTLRERNPKLKERVLSLARAHPRFGFRRIHALLPGVNLKAVHRIWRQEGLRLSRRTRKRLKVVRQPQSELTGSNQAWCMDFVHERLQNGRQVRILGVLDCFTRECLLLRAGAQFPSSDVQRELNWLFLINGRPGRVVSDNGPEFRALELPKEIDRAFIEPGKPWQNGRIESFFDKLRDELLNCELYLTGAELQAGLDQYREFYNQLRPQRCLQGRAPANFKTSIEAGIRKSEILKL